MPGKYRLKLPTARDRELPSFWECASEAGRTVVNARVPMSYPVGPVNGLQVADSLAPSPAAPGFAYPETLARDLRRRFGHAFWLEPVDLMGSGSYSRILEGLLDGVDRTFELFTYLLARERADLFFGVVREADYAGHAFWGFHSGRLPSPDGTSAHELRDAVLKVYQRIDQRLGELLTKRPSGTNLLIVSDHGMGDEPRVHTCVGPLLEAAGLMVSREPAPEPPPPLWRRARTAVGRHVPWSLRRRLRPLNDQAWADGFTAFHLASIDFGRSRAFSYYAGLTGEIWLNLKDRDPEGMVAPGDEQAELEHDLAEMFRSCREARSGQPIAQRVCRREELFSGGCVPRLADLHVMFDLDLPVERLRAQFRGREFEVALAPIGDGHCGMHRPYATFLACGPDIRRGVPPIHGTLMDLAPTALTLLRVPIPAFVEGEPLTEALRPFVTPRAAGAYEYTLASLPATQYTREDLSVVEQRLANLGYL